MTKVAGRLASKVAIVTGAGGTGRGLGVGQAIAHLAATEGARVALLDLSAENIDVTLRMISQDGGQAIPIQCDVTEPEQCRSAVDTVVAQWGRLDILVNNVGVSGGRSTAVDVDVAAWERGIRANLTSMVLMGKYAVPAMMRAGNGGAIVNISSIMGLRGGTNSIIYAASKGAVPNLTRAMAFQHGPDRIRVNCVVPGHVFTPMAVAEGLTEAGREARRQRSLLKTEGSASDVAYAVVYLASDEASWVTGVVLPVDGGYLAAEPRS